MQRTERYIEIDAPVHRVFDYFSDFENLPRWMDSIRKVQYIGPRRTHWVADAPLGSSVEWDAETTRFEQDRRIAWRSIRGSMATNGEVTFEPTRRNTTLMHVDLGYDPPAGRLGALVARLFGNNPEHQLDQDLQRFKRLVERQLQYQEDDYYPDQGRREREHDNREEERLSPQRERLDRDHDDWRDRDRSRVNPEEREHSAFSQRPLRDHHPEDHIPGPDYPREHPDDYRSADRRPTDRNQNERPNEPELDRDSRIRRRGVDRLLDEGPSSRWHR